MGKGYFHRVHELSPTRFWINNPTRAEAQAAIDAGATGCTCNPSYCQKMLDHPEERSYALALLDEALEESDEESEVEAILQRKLVAGIADVFRPMYESTGRDCGYVSIQGDPIREHDSTVITSEAHKNRAIGDNICIKIPATAAGLEAMKELVAAGVPINATEVFAISQARDVCEMYMSVSRKSGRSPKMWLSHIAGIYDDFLGLYATEHNLDIEADLVVQAGLSISRIVYATMKEKGYPITLIGGGARGLHHFTEMVGGDCVVTINWKGTADKLLELDPPVVWRLFNPVPQHVVDELVEKFPDFRRGWEDNGLRVEEYDGFGPVELFRSSFTKSWKKVLGVIKERGSVSDRLTKPASTDHPSP